MPATPTPEVRQMMLQAFGKMAVPPAPNAAPLLHDGQLGEDEVQPCPVSVWAPTPSPATLSPLKPASSMPLGTWSRQVGAVRYKIDVKDNSLTAIVTISGEEKGKLISIDYILTADCYPTRNPGEIVGIISSFDISVDDESFDAIEGLKSLPDLQKEIGGKPMAFTFSVIEDVLVLGNVRLPFNKDEGDEFVVAFRALGGRYKKGNPLPPMSPASKRKKDDEFGGMTLPSGRYLEHQPQYFPADPVFPLPRELAPPPIPPAADEIPTPKSNPFRNGGLPVPLTR
jgi:hypothetical protein